MILRIVPYSVSYATVEKLNKYATILLYASTAISITISLLGYFNLIPDLKNTLIGINILFICVYGAPRGVCKYKLKYLCG